MLEKTVNQYRSFSSFLVTNLWWTHNMSIFNEKDTLPEIIVGITLNQAKIFKSEIKSKNPMVSVMPELGYEIPWGFFDGAYQRHPHVCDVRVVLFMNQNHYSHICYVPGTGTNNKVEFITL
jgi:hypothetical protein